MHAPPRILIVGAGFAGTMLAFHLAANAREPLHITLCDAGAAFTKGVAYSTRSPLHLLNVRADRMGAFEDRPDDFYRWLLANEAHWRHMDPAFVRFDLTPESFMPRMVYGAYIASLFEKTRAFRRVSIEQIPKEVTSAQLSEDGITAAFADGTECRADRLVLALGNLLAGKPRFDVGLLDTPRYTRSIWSPARGSILTRNLFSEEDSPVLIIGTGLTMVDAFLSLRAVGYRGKIIAVSRHGYLPLRHEVNSSAYPRFLDPESAPRNALGLFKAIRNEVKKAAAAGIGWHGVIDALRADTVTIWAQLPESERAKLARLLSCWSSYRHRMPPSSANALEKEIQSGELTIMAGSIKAILHAGERLEVEIRADGQNGTIATGHVINCTGPLSDIATSGSSLLQSLLTQGTIRRGPLHMGIAAKASGEAKGNAPGKLYALGPLLTGERLETIAVPELRKQAEMLASSLLESL